MDLSRLSALLPWAFSAGMVATVNPCGFAMLPAYLSYLLGRTGAGALRGSLARASGAGLGMTAGLLSIFLVAGTAVSSVGSALMRFVPAVGVVVGLIVAGVGIAMLLRPSLHVSLSLSYVPNDVVARSRGLRFVFFGAAFGLASLGCTLPIFLIVTTQALAAGGVVPGIVVFLAYAMGMGVVLIALSLSVAAGSTFLVRTLRDLAPSLHRLGAAGMVVAGAYLAYYQLAYGRLLLRP